MYLVDTNVLSELARRTPDEGVLSWASGVTDVSVSVITVEEISCGLSHRQNSRLSQWFQNFFISACSVVPVDDVIARTAGNLRGRLLASGRPRSQFDMLIGATALVGGLTLVTRNVRDFDGTGVTLLNPFTEVPTNR